MRCDARNRRESRYSSFSDPHVRLSFSLSSIFQYRVDFVRHLAMRVPGTPFADRWKMHGRSEFAGARHLLRVTSARKPLFLSRQMRVVSYDPMRRRRRLSILLDVAVASRSVVFLRSSFINRFRSNSVNTSRDEIFAAIIKYCILFSKRIS